MILETLWICQRVIPQISRGPKLYLIGGTNTYRRIPTRVNLEKVSMEYDLLYQWEDMSPPGWPVPTHVA